MMMEDFGHGIGTLERYQSLAALEQELFYT